MVREPTLATLKRLAEAQDPEPCSCEESEALRRRLRRIHQLTLTYDSTARDGAVTALQRIRGLSE